MGQIMAQRLLDKLLMCNITAYRCCVVVHWCSVCYMQTVNTINSHQNSTPCLDTRRFTVAKASCWTLSKACAGSTAAILYLAGDYMARSYSRILAM